MKLIDLHEYRKAPLGSEFSKAAVINLLADEDNVQVLRTHIAVPGEKDLIVVRYRFDDDNLLFALVNRVDHDDVAGYLRVLRRGKFWQVQDTAIYSAYRGRGLGTDLYIRIIQHGYALMSGTSLSDEAEKVWKVRLPAVVKVQVYDVKNNAASPFSDAPTFDDGADDEQTMFYVAEHTGKHGAVLENYHPDSGLNNLMYENWLLDRGISICNFRAVRHGQEGDL